MRHITRFAVALLSAAATLPTIAQSQDSTWLAAPGSSAYNVGSNWTPSIVPTGTAIFGASNTTSIQLPSSGTTTIGTFRFNANAPTYTFNGASDLRFTSGGIVNNSSSAPNISTLNGITFSGNSTAANAILQGGFGGVTFADNSSAGNASVLFQNSRFINSATAANATISGQASFRDTSTAGNATITVLSVVNNLEFRDRSTAGNATLFSIDRGQIHFSGDSSAENARITNDGGGLAFFDRSTAANAVINSINGGFTRFDPTASTGQARLITDSRSTVDLVGESRSVGSIEGAGRFAVLALPPAQLIIGTNGLSTTVTGTIASLNQLTLVKVGNGTFTMAGTGTFAGSTVLNGGNLVVSGSLASGVTVNTGSAIVNGVVGGPSAVNGGVLAGGGTIGNLTVNGGAVAPGNSIGTLRVNGNFAQNAGSFYQMEVTAAGQGDRINVAGVATLNGGIVAVQPLAGNNAASATYTILNAAGGVNGTFAAASSSFPFLLPSLRYDPNNVYLILQAGGFAAAAQTPLQYTVGSVLDASAANASGDFSTILGSLSTQQSAQVLPFLAAISGNNYAAFSSSMVQGAQLFMNNFANQTGGGGSPFSNRVALAAACDVTCDSAPSPLWGAWGGGLGGLGTIGANAPLGAVTYNVGGFAAGLDRLVAPNIRVGVTAGFTAGTQWVSGFDGLGRSDSFLVGLYGGYSKDKVYADAIVGYAYSSNQMWRNISIPGVQQRTAQGWTGANQFYGQIETGYRFDLGGTADVFITPFARLQGYTGTQNAFAETGAQSLNLTVAQQTTNSLRSVLGAQLGGAFDLGWRERLAMQLRLGWSHEYADTARPVTAILAGAPAMAFTTYGVAPQRDGVVVGFSANTAIAESTSLYLRYEGDISGQDSSHALTAGVRLTW